MTDKTQQILRDWVEAFQSLYPNDTLEYELVDGKVRAGNGMTYTLSDIKVHTAKMRSQLGRSVFTQVGDTEEDRSELVQAIKSGNRGNLVIGKFLQNRYERGRTKLASLEAWLRNQGLRLPSEGTRSKYRQAYEAWVRNAGLDLTQTYTHPNFTDDTGNPIPMTLQGVSTYTLYEARNLVTRENAVELLARCYESTIDEIKDAASNANAAREPGDEVRSLPKVPKSVYDMFSSLSEAFPDKSKLHVIEFLILFVADLQQRNPEVFDEAVAAYFGEQTE